MLTELSLTNFRCFDRHTLPLRRRTIIVGRNNAGKSTVVDALRLVSIVASRYGSLPVRDVPDWLDVPRINRGVAPSLDDVDLQADALYYRYGAPPAVVTARFDSGASVRIYLGGELPHRRRPGAPLVPRMHAVVLDADGTPVTSRGALARSLLPRVSILPQVGPLERQERILMPDYVRSALGSSLTTLHFRNQINLFPEHVPLFSRLVEESWPGLRVNGLVRSGDNAWAPVRDPLELMIRDGDFVAEASRMGHGLQMWLQTMWFLARSANDPTIILNEPDVYMHSDLQRRLIRSLESRPGQVIVATHSVEILAEVDPDDVLVVDRMRRKSRFATSLPAVQDVVDRMGGVHDLQLARLWTARRVLLLEGDDLPYMRLFHSAVCPGASEPLDAIPRLSIGGWSGFPFAVGSRMLLENAGGEAIVPYCILDSDYHTPEQIAERHKTARERGIQLHIWKRKEIENYLLVPDAIARVIAARRGDGADPPSAADVGRVLDRIAAGLKDATTDAIASEEHAADRARGVAQANGKARARVGRAWRTAEGRWGIVSGKAMLSELSTWSQKTYGSSISAIAIARALRASELDAEVAGVVKAINRGVPLDEQ